MSTVIDAHHHFWLREGRSTPWDYAWQDAPELSPIRRSFGPADLEPLIDAAGVDRTVFVQAQHHLEETRWALGLAEQNDFLAGVVGWVDLASPDCEAQLEEFKDHAKFVGVRHVVQDEPDDNFIIRDDVMRGLKVLEKHRVPYDLLFYVKHLRHTPALAEALPELPMVIDHLAKPHIKDRRTDDWLDHFIAAAKYDNVYCKLSGMITEANWRSWTADDLKPYVHAALDAFGPQRLMFGSDWPVCTLAGSYPQVLDALNAALGPITDAERHAIFGETAMTFYGL